MEAKMYERNTAHALLRQALLLVAFCGLWLLLSLLSGAATSGYHLEDDDVVLVVQEQVHSGEGIWRIMYEMLVSDCLNGKRFRPVCIATWVLGIGLMGDNFFAWSVYRALLAGIASFLLYQAGRGLGLRKAYALVFLAIGLLGPQASVWMMRAPAEGWGTILLALGLVAMTREQAGSSGGRAWGAVTALSWAAMALTKESFLALTPALVMLRSALIASRTGLPWVQANRRHPWASLLLLGWSAGIVALMARTSGVAGPGFTGVVWDPLRILETALQFAAYNAQGLVLALLAVLYVVVNRGVANPGGAVFAVAVFGCALGPQAVIHSASGLPLSAERYVIPASLVHALPVALLLQWLVDTFRERDLSSLRPVLHWVEGSLIVGLLAGLVAGFCAVSGMGSAAILDGIAAFTNRAISSHWPALLHRLGYAVSAGCLAGLGVAAAYRRTPQPLRVARMAVTAMVAYLAAATWESSRAFAKEGWDAMCVINTVAAVETSPSVLMVVDPAADAPEKVYSVTEYLRIKKRIGNIVYHLIDTAPATGYRAAWRAELLQCYGERLVGVPGALVSTTCVVVLSQQDEFVRRAGSDALRAFSKTTCGPMTVYCRAESGELTP